MTKAFYVRSGSTFAPTDYVTGPWDPDLSHAGPPAALLLNAVAQQAEDMGISRATFEIPRGIPKVPCTIEIEDVRPGAKIRLLRASLRSETDDVLMSAHMWCIRTTHKGLPTSDPYPLELPSVDECEPFGLDFGVSLGYMDGVDMRIARGTPFLGGPAAIWIRQTIPLIDGESADPYALCGMFGDLGNGISAIEPLNQLFAVNTDLTLYMARRPIGEWVASESLTISHGLGLGMTDSLVYDATGFVGKANQSIFFDRL